MVFGGRSDHGNVGPISEAGETALDGVGLGRVKGLGGGAIGRSGAVGEDENLVAGGTELRCHFHGVGLHTAEARRKFREDQEQPWLGHFCDRIPFPERR
jgi:hypothetical protein